MACNYPVATMRKDGTPALRPCGHCLGCHLNYSRGWAVRAMHEAELHEENSFITLTFDDDHLPEDRSVHREDLQKFFKRLRDHNHGKDIRYLACGEYGDKKGRPHYHCCVFGLDFSDKELLVRGNYKQRRNRFYRGVEYDLYISKSLADVWKYGNHTIGSVTTSSTRYVAGYVTKKDPKGGKKYPDGRLKEFALMSRNPALGLRWIKKYFTDCFPKDFLVHNGKVCPVPRYYDSYCKKYYPELWKRVEKKRRERSEYSAQGTEPMQRKHGKELYQKAMIKRNQERSYEDEYRKAGSELGHLRGV